MLGFDSIKAAALQWSVGKKLPNCFPIFGTVARILQCPATSYLFRQSRVIEVHVSHDAYLLGQDTAVCVKRSPKHGMGVTL